MTILSRAAFCLLLLSGSACFAQPAIVSGKIATPVVNVTKPDASPGIDLVVSGKATSISFLLQGPSGEFTSVNFLYPAGFPAHAHLRGYVPIQYATLGLPNQAFSLYSEAGTWTLATGEICDASGNCSYYDSSQLAALFPSISFQLNNPNPSDIQPPFILHGAIKTPTISVSGNKPFKLVLNVTDNLSGVAAENVCAQMGTGTPICFNSGPYYGHALSGNFPVVYKLPPNTAPGTYTITSVAAVDVAGNALGYTNPGQLNGIFSNNVTFTVTP